MIKVSAVGDFWFNSFVFVAMTINLIMSCCHVANAVQQLPLHCSENQWKFVNISEIRQVLKFGMLTAIAAVLCFCCVSAFGT